MSAKLLIILCLALSASSSKSPLFMPTVPLPLAQTKEFLFGFGKGLHLFNYIDEPTLSKCFTVSIGMETNFSVLTTILANIHSVDDIYGRWSEISKYANFIYAEIKQQFESQCVLTLDGLHVYLNKVEAIVTDLTYLPNVAFRVIASLAEITQSIRDIKQAIELSNFSKAGLLTGQEAFKIFLPTL